MSKGPTRRAWQKAKIAQGMCPSCGTRPRGETVQLCAACRDRRNALLRARRASHVAKKLCAICGVRTITNASRCGVCNDRHNAYQRASRALARTTPEPREPPRRTAIASETQDTPERSGLALIGPTKPKAKNNQFKHEETPLCSRIVTQYELRKMGAWKP